MKAMRKGAAPTESLVVFDLLVRFGQDMFAQEYMTETKHLEVFSL